MPAYPPQLESQANRLVVKKYLIEVSCCRGNSPPERLLFILEKSINNGSVWAPQLLLYWPQRYWRIQDAIRCIISAIADLPSRGPKCNSVHPWRSTMLISAPAEFQ